MSGQTNLIANPGFEDKDSCTTGYWPKFWYNPTYGTSDYIAYGNLSGFGCINYPVAWGNYADCWGNNPPEDMLNQIGFCGPHSGNAFVGSVIGMGEEYIANELNDTLRAGKTYLFEFYVRLSNVSSLGLDRIGAVFTTNRLIHYNQQTYSSMYIDAPMMAGTDDGQCITDTSDWVFVSDTFTAGGGEKYMTVGVTDSVGQMKCRVRPTGNGSYYLFDDFNLVCLDCNDTIPPPRPLAPVTAPAPAEGFTIHPNPATDRIRVITYVKQSETASFQLFDLAGQLVFTAPLMPEQNEYQFDISGLPPGAYVAAKLTVNEQINRESLMLVIVR